jgi:NADPH-dependent 2,4-dienoyl-CoA reductase/sulfur reductase-like enzyme
MRSADSSVLAAGDVAKAQNASAGRALRVEHWGEALRQGEIAGAVAAGAAVAWDDVPGFWSTIGDRTLKYAAWGDGYDDVRLVDHGDGAFTAWYARDGACVGVLTHERDEDYDSGRERIEQGEPPP